MVLIKDLVTGIYNVKDTYRIIQVYITFKIFKKKIYYGTMVSLHDFVCSIVSILINRFLGCCL